MDTWHEVPLWLWSFLVSVHVQEQVKRAERQFQSLPQHHQNLLPDVLSNLARISQCADQNQELLQAIVQNSLHMFENIEYGERVRLDLHQVVYYACTHRLYYILCCKLLKRIWVKKVASSLNPQEDPQKVHPSSTFDMDKLKSTIKQFVRDWSEVGQAERDSCYQPIIQEIQRLFPSDQ